MPIADTILVLSGLLAVAMIASSLCRNLPIPYSVILVLLGLGISSLAEITPMLAPLMNFGLTPDLVFFVFLPALIFESALNLDARQLISDIAPIMVLAVVALLLSTAIIGIGIWWLLDLSFVLALLFGALIAATDPVAVVALFKELGAPKRLTTLVEGESLFNDATAIVLFHILLGIALSGSFLASDMGHAVGEFLRVFFGGILVGGVIGFGISELMRRLGGSQHAILVMSFVMAYASFVIAEHTLHVSGVMAAVASALSMGIYAVSRMPQSAVSLLHESWEVIALICNSLLFLMIGLSVDVGVLFNNFGAILFAAMLVILARAASVYSLVPATTKLFNLPWVSIGERHIMWWGGLKGGLAIAIVLSIPVELAGRQTLIELTLGVVLFTLLVNAPTIRPLIKHFDIDRMSEEEQAELNRGLYEAKQQAHAVLDQLEKADLLDASRAALIAEELDHTLDQGSPAASRDRSLRQAHIEALKIESNELENIYALGLIREYAYLDCRASLRRQKERWASTEKARQPMGVYDASVFERLEKRLLRWMREQNWATQLLAKFQRARLSQSVERAAAGILCCEKVLAQLPLQAQLDTEHVAEVLTRYTELIKNKRASLAAVRDDFPAFFESLETHFSKIAALQNAKHRIESGFHHGELGAKAYTLIDQRIQQELDRPSAIINPSRKLSASELIERIPLFESLSGEVLEKLASKTQAVTFLTGDVIIGENDKGTALYIIAQGRVSISKRAADGSTTQLAILDSGEFFGEAALLGNEIRTATATALSTLKLLRLTRRSIQQLAKEQPEIEAQLAEAVLRRAGRLSPGSRH